MQRVCGVGPVKTRPKPSRDDELGRGLRPHVLILFTQRRLDVHSALHVIACDSLLLTSKSGRAAVQGSKAVCPNAPPPKFPVLSGCVSRAKGEPRREGDS